MSPRYALLTGFELDRRSFRVRLLVGHRLGPTDAVPVREEQPLVGDWLQPIVVVGAVHYISALREAEREPGEPRVVQRQRVVVVVLRVAEQPGARVLARNPIDRRVDDEPQGVTEFVRGRSGTRAWATS